MRKRPSYSRSSGLIQPPEKENMSISFLKLTIIFQTNEDKNCFFKKQTNKGKVRFLTSSSKTLSFQPLLLTDVRLTVCLLEMLDYSICILGRRNKKWRVISFKERKNSQEKSKCHLRPSRESQVCLQAESQWNHLAIFSFNNSEIYLLWFTRSSK